MRRAIFATVCYKNLLEHDYRLQVCRLQVHTNANLQPVTCNKSFYAFSIKKRGWSYSTGEESSANIFTDSSFAPVKFNFIKSFMASMMHNVSPPFTASPTLHRAPYQRLVCGRKVPTIGERKVMMFSFLGWAARASDFGVAVSDA